MAESFVLIDAAGPSFTPLRYGILAVAERPTPADSKWLHGIVRDERFCGVPDSYPLLPCTGSPYPEGGLVPTDAEGIVFPESDAFQVYAWLPCSPVGMGNDLERLRSRTRQALTDGAPRAVEPVFWTGETSIAGSTIYPHLASDVMVTGGPMGATGPHTVRQRAADEVTTAAVDITEAVGLVEEQLAECYGGEGIIHVPRRALAALDNAYLARREGDQLRTLSGNRIAAYSGEGVGNAPDGTTPAAGVRWIYGTGMAQVYSSPPKELGLVPGEFIGKADNTTVFVIAQNYLLTWDCCLVAAEVQFGGAASGAVGAAGGVAA